MLEKTVFKAASTSYSQFLEEKRNPIHCITEPSDSLDINFFKHSISLHYQHLYATKKRQNWLYRCIFFGFGLLFLTLAILIFFKTTNFACGFYFSNCSIIKNSINCFCLFLATGAFAFSYKIHPEKDAIRDLVAKVEKELKSPGKRLQIEFNTIFANLSNEWITPHQTVWIKKD